MKCIRHSGNQSTHDVAYVSIFSFLNSLAASLAKLGVGRELRENCLIDVCVRECHGDVEFVQEHAERIHDIAFNPALRLGRAVIKPKVKRVRLKSLPPSMFTRLLEVLDACIKSFPDELSMYEGYRQLRCAAKENGIPESEIKHVAVWRALKKAGFKVVGRQWQRPR